jgi:hypothetical protein
MGRPTKLTDARHRKIVADIRAGNFAQIAAVASGITEQTYYNWLNRGQADLGSEEPSDHVSIYAKFFEAVKRAEAEAEVKQLRAMQTDDKWQRRAWWLERRFPKRWGQKQSLELSGPDGGPVAITDASKQELEAFLDERKEAIEAAQAAMAEARGEDTST